MDIGERKSDDSNERYISNLETEEKGYCFAYNLNTILSVPQNTDERDIFDEDNDQSPTRIQEPDGSTYFE